MPETIRASDNGWRRLVYRLEGLVKPESPHAEDINRALIIVDFSLDLGNEIWAANYVVKKDDELRCMIHVDKKLFQPLVGEREESQKRKCILAHEWVEGLYELFNYQSLGVRRSVAGKTKMYALMGVCEFGLPWQDTDVHMKQLTPALCDLLVSEETLLRLMSESQFGSSEQFFIQFTAKLRESRGAAENFLLKFSEEVSIKINVARGLVRSRIGEVLRLAPGKSFV